ncbi:MAG: hypothetical protein VXY91_01835 [Bacteroidota bacterium]|nr:hypothetical protein [Bacteroidota bacterium]
MNDDKIFDELIDIFHPDLLQFFLDYIAYREALPIQEYLLNVNINYHQRFSGRRSANLISYFKVRTKRIHGSNKVQISKIGKNVPIDFQQGDLVELFSSK